MQFAVESMCFVGASPSDFGGACKDGYWAMPNNWEAIGLGAYLGICAKISVKQRDFAARGGLRPDVVAAVITAASKNEAVQNFGDAADIDDAALGQVGSYYGARVYRSVQPDYSRDGGSWELQMEFVRKMEDLHRWLLAAEVAAKQSPTSRVSKGWADFDLRPVP